MTHRSRALRAAVILVLLGALPAPRAPRAAETLDILQPGYPRAFFFRSSESMAARPTPFAQWDAIFSRLDGIMGKALDEEIPGRSRTNIAAFTRFKQAHPGQAVLLHFNGNARDPRFRPDRFFAGHWLYYNGCRLTAALPEGGGEMVVHVPNPNLFKANIGRFGNSNEDLAICRTGGDGKPDWSRCEQVQLVALDAAGKTLTVRRGAYGTKPLAFPKGSYLAAHASEGPWGKGSNLLWFYNFSSTCPRDAQGRSCSDALAADLGELFAPGGPLAAFDGISLDVSQFDRAPRTPRAGRGGRGFDADGDGILDDGLIGGLNVYGIGQAAFHEALRRTLGEEKLILADGMSWRNQRSFGVLNGIESEGFPTLGDWAMADWSGGLNRHYAWRAAARPPALNYLNHKYMIGAEQARPEVPFNIHRLAFAAAVFTDAAVCYSYLPPGEPGEAVPIWDELIAGAAHRRHWLGQPLGEAIRLGRRAPDLLGGAGMRMDAGFAGRWQSGEGTIAGSGGELKIAGAKAGDGQLSATLAGVSVPAGDLLVFATLRGEPRAGYSRQTPRLAGLTLKSDGKHPLSALTPERLGSWVNETKLEAGFYFRDVGPATVSLTLNVEGSEPVTVSGMTLHNAPDAIVRRFEQGLVLANPSTRPFTFDLSELASGAALRRIQGTARQDPQTNNGEAAGKDLTLGPMDGIFLVRDK